MAWSLCTCACVCMREESCGLMWQTEGHVVGGGDLSALAKVAQHEARVSSSCVLCRWKRDLVSKVRQA